MLYEVITDPAIDVDIQVSDAKGAPVAGAEISAGGSTTHPVVTAPVPELV